MTVWQLTLALLSHVIRGRGRHRVYVSPGKAAPGSVGAEFVSVNWTVTGTYPPYFPRSRWVGATIEPEQDQ